MPVFPVCVARGSVCWRLVLARWSGSPVRRIGYRFRPAGQRGICNARRRFAHARRGGSVLRVSGFLRLCQRGLCGSRRRSERHLHLRLRSRDTMRFLPGWRSEKCLHRLLFPVATAFPDIFEIRIGRLHNAARPVALAPIAEVFAHRPCARRFGSRCCSVFRSRIQGQIQVRAFRLVRRETGRCCSGIVPGRCRLFCDKDAPAAGGRDHSGG